MCVYTNDAEDALLQIEDKWSYKHKALFLSRKMRSRTQMQRIVSFNNKIKQRRTKTTPKGKNKQAGRQAGIRLEHSQHETLTT